MDRKILSLSILILLLYSCSERIFTEGKDLSVRFSTDTIHFDTVFTTIGSVSREFRVINPYKTWLRIENISLSGGDNSPFRINIDGEAKTSVSDIELAPHDSIFIFIDVIIDPSGEDTPLAVMDSILVQTASSEQYVFLIAWGQDIHLLSERNIQTETWTNDKPWVIYNSVFIEAGEVLTIDAGTEVLFHRGAIMYVAGTLIVNGEISNKTVFRSDRLERQYNNIPGQWRGIYFINGSSGNNIYNSIIENGESGLHLGNLGTNDAPPDLKISNTVIRNMTVSGLSSLGGEIEAINCEISHCGFYSLFLAMGGTYSFTHCTIANLWEYSVRLTPAVLISDYYDYGETRYPGVFNGIRFKNSVIFGSSINEVDIFPADKQTTPAIEFTNTLLKIDLSNPIWNNYDLSSSLINSDPKFIEFMNFDFRPDTLSLLTGSANPSISLTVPLDIRGFSRFADTGPDIGAYERQTGERSKK